MSQLWNELDAGLPVISSAKAIQIQLEPSRQGRLRVSCLGGAFPEGELYLILSNWPETRHWYVPAQVEDGVLTANMAGAEAAYDPEDPRPLLVILAQRTERGLIQYPLRARRLLSRLKPANRCRYFYNERDLWSGPVDQFSREERLYEAVPQLVQSGEKIVSLALAILPRSLRYWTQFSYGLTKAEWRDSCLWVQTRTPEGAPSLEGLSLHREDGDERWQRFFPARPERDGDWVCVDLRRLPRDGIKYVLSGVLSAQEDVLFHVPLSVIDAKLHHVLEERSNGELFSAGDGLGCYLELDDLCHLYFMVGTARPTCQRNIPANSLWEALEGERLPVQGHCMICDLGGRDWHWQLELPRYGLLPEDELLMVARKKGERALLPVTLLSGGDGHSLLSADFSLISQRLQNSLIARWELSLAIRRGTDWYHMLLRIPERTIRRRLDTDLEYLNYTFAYGAPIGSAPLGDQTVDGLIACPGGGYCELQTADRIRRYERQMTCRGEMARLRGSRLFLKIRCPSQAPGQWTGIALVHRYKLELDRAVCFLPARQVTKRNGVVWMTVEADLSRFRFTPLYWDIRAVFRGEDGNSYLTQVRATVYREKDERRAARRKGRAERTLFSNSYRQGSDLTVAFYRTAGNGYALVCQEYSPYSGFLFRVKERLAIILSEVFRKRLDKKSIFLCYEKYCCMAQDNGFYFFRHCMEQGMEQKMNRSIYFVIDKKQPDYRERLLPYKDHVIQFMSLKHMVYLLAARLLISSDSKAHAYAWRAKESIIIPRIQANKKLVFLQHGVIALKRVEFYSKGTNAVQLFITSNQREHDIIVQEMAYPTEDVVITGLARWDVLEDKGLEERHILVMPTWRNWLEEVSDAAFMTSDYYRNYMSLLNDPRLASLLERQDLYLDFYIHPKFRDYLADFSIQEGGRVRLIPFGTEPLNQLIMGCKLLVTDYSSVCWDVYYQGKPVLFYQFDVERYNETTGAYIDLETELFGERVMTPEELLVQLEAYAQNGFRLPEKYAAMRPKMYAYLDHNNSQRVCEEIMKRHW